MFLQKLVYQHSKFRLDTPFSPNRVKYVRNLRRLPLYESLVNILVVCPVRRGEISCFLTLLFNLCNYGKSSFSRLVVSAVGLHTVVH